jgi:hypothetical protein
MVLKEKEKKNTGKAKIKLQIFIVCNIVFTKKVNL